MKKLKSWCPQPQDRLTTKLKSYSKPTGIAIAVTLILVVSFSLILTNYALTQSVAQAPIIKTPIETSNGTLPTTSPSPTNTTLMTKDEALSMAMPIIQQYAIENNRTITYVNASLGKTTNSTRGGPTIEQVLQGNISVADAQKHFIYYPMWAIVANFDLSIYANKTYPSNAPWEHNGEIIGYSVKIWADTGQIFDSSPGSIAIM